ncbi:ATP-binding protein [Hyphobacterium sp.]|uniref:sensor histidine kinase n=1 Tax=Hyphobacterium sp. TaxID=2004662 RepID=UPI003B52EBF8
MSRQLPSFVRTTAFRLTLLSAALFALSSFLILAFVYAASAGAALRRTDAVINDELAAVERRYDESGIQGVNRYILQRTVGGSDVLYLLINPNGRLLSGNLNGMPEAPVSDEGWLDFVYGRSPVDGEDSARDSRRARARAVPIGDGYTVFVGIDIENENRLIGRMLRAILAASALVIALGIISGVVVSRRFSRRLDAVNMVARTVMRGDLTRRAPRDGSGDELDELSANFNSMLDRLEELMHRMRNVGDSIAHDLRSPLTRMRNRMEDALRAEGDRPSRQAALEQALNDSDELLGVFNAILSISRIEAGERRDSFEIFDPGPLVTDMGELYEPVCEDSGHDFGIQAESGLVIRGDPNLVSQAMANMLDNAVKYTPSGGAIQLRLRQCSDGRPEISVTDTGPGIAEADRLRVTQRFVRLEESRNQPGSGLGLSLVKAIADIHRAELVLDDGPGSHDGQGAGLRIALIFPIAEKTA